MTVVNPVNSVSVIVPTRNEEENLADALESIAWADEIIIVDSHSTDRTVEIACDVGAEVVQFDYDGSGPKKKSWALEALSPKGEWIMLLDADERVTPELAAEIREAIRDSNADGFCIDREFIFMGRSLRCFRPNWNLRLFKRGRGHFEDLGLDDLPQTGDNEIHEHVLLDGELGFLGNALRHDDYRGLTAWLDRHNKYATWEAHLYLKFRREPIGVGPVGFLRLDPFRRKRVLRRVWVRLPFRPALRFFVWYVLRRGFLDGKEGFIFCVLMAYYEFIIGAKLRELRMNERV